MFWWTGERLTFCFVALAAVVVVVSLSPYFLGVVALTQTASLSFQNKVIVQKMDGKKTLLDAYWKFYYSTVVEILVILAELSYCMIYDFLWLDIVPGV